LLTVIEKTDYDTIWQAVFLVTGIAGTAFVVVFVL